MRLSSSKRHILLLMLVLLGTSVFAQSNVDSPYSIFGVGQVRAKSMNACLRGMGGINKAMYGKGLVNAANPASYAMIDSLAFLFDAGMYFKTSTFSTSSMAERAANASFDYVAMAFGLTDWWKLCVGAQPYSVMGYNMIVNSHKDELGSYATSFKGTGGLNQAFLGTSFRLGKHFSVGANGTYVFGDYGSQTTLFFPDSMYFISSRRGVDMMVSSFMFDYGLLYNTDLGNGLNLGIGLTYDQKVNLRGKQTIFVRSIEDDGGSDIEYVIDTIFYDVKNDSKLTMPQGFGVGFTLRKNDRWCVGADFDWSQWSKFSREGINDSLQDSWRVSLGGEFTPVSSSVSNYFTRVTYRAGGFYEHTYLNINGNSINKMGISFGASLPLPRSLSKVNLALEVGQCGTKLDGLIQERYVNLKVGISVFERWFMKRKYK